MAAHRPTDKSETERRQRTLSSACSRRRPITGAPLMTAATYARVSTPDQDPTAQVEQLRAYCQARGWECHEYLDHGVSGAKARRDTLYGPVMRAQDDAQRLEEQRRREAQEEAQRVAEQRANEERERQEAAERASALVRFGTKFAYDALQDVEDRDEHEQQRILQRVELELEEQLTGDESKHDVQGRVDKVLDEELAEADDDEDEGWDEHEDDDDEDEEDDADGGYDEEEDD
jgi:hypothetical protein